MVLPGQLFAQGFVRPLGPWDFLATLGMSAYTGYFGHRNGVDISFSASDQAGNSVERLRQQYQLQGVTTQLIFPVRVTGPVGVVIGGGYSACFPSSSDETLQRAGAVSLTRTWKTQPQACNVQIAGTLDIFPSLLGMLGFRYENFQTRFSDPNSGNTAQLSGSDSANIAYNAYLPYLGFIVCPQTPFQGLSMQLGFIGCPVLLGSVEYRETWNETVPLQIGGQPVPGFVGSNPIGRGGYFDIFGELSLMTCCGLQLGAYAKYEYMSAATGVYVGQGNSGIPTVVYDFDFERRLWGVGGRVSMAF
jgi:hypothetical protein